MSVTVTNLQRKIPVDLERLRHHGFLALSALRKNRSMLSIVLVNDRRMRRLNRAYRGLARTTDVLSFSVDIPLPRGKVSPFLGEIVISAPKAETQSRDQGIGLDDELSNLMIHGICHLLGYDHELGVGKAREMKKIEQKISEAIRKKDRTLSLPGNITGKIPRRPEIRKPGKGIP